MDVLVRENSDPTNLSVMSEVPTLWSCDWAVEDEDGAEIVSMAEWKARRSDDTAYQAFRPSIDAVAYGDAFAVALEERIPALTSLKLLYIPHRDEEDLADEARSSAAWARILQVCQERGVEVIEEHHDYREDSQIPLDFWRRHRKEKENERRGVRGGL